MFPNKCVVCRKECSPPAPACNVCTKPVCYDCRPGHIEQHVNSGITPAFRLGFCFPCVRVRPVKWKGGVAWCKHCHGEVSFRAAVSQTVTGQVICPYCGAMQKKDSLPAPCARCRMQLI